MQVYLLSITTSLKRIIRKVFKKIKKWCKNYYDAFVSLIRHITKRETPKHLPEFPVEKWLALQSAQVA
nr:MAG TPA: hypothetical protein [Caudoviricetes sp.]